MDKFLFLKTEGTVFTESSCKEGEPLWNNPMDKNSVEMLNLVIKDTNLKIIILDVPDRVPYATVSQKFSDAGFKYPENLIGQAINPERVIVATPYDGLGLEPFPILMGNCIKYWVDNFLAKPYKLHPEKGKDFEIWEYPENGDPEFKGMKILKEKDDFVYRILGTVDGLLAEQQKKMIECSYSYGFNLEKAKELVLSF